MHSFMELEVMSTMGTQASTATLQTDGAVWEEQTSWAHGQADWLVGLPAHSYQRKAAGTGLEACVLATALRGTAFAGQAPAATAWPSQQSAAPNSVALPDVPPSQLRNCSANPTEAGVAYLRSSSAPAGGGRGKSQLIPPHLQVNRGGIHNAYRWYTAVASAARQAARHRQQGCSPQALLQPPD